MCTTFEVLSFHRSMIREGSRNFKRWSRDPTLGSTSSSVGHFYMVDLCTKFEMPIFAQSNDIGSGYEYLKGAR